MLTKILRISIEIIIILNCVCSENLLKQNDLSKLSVGDLQMCIDSFNIHKDKIIRTQDSLSLGGKYLMEVEAPERQSCLRLCCQTEDCDVFIYEEKKPGSCYLFHCGPPHDFKCKFTGHANYSSAVLTNMHYRNAENLQEHMRRSQQEYELKSLRKVGDSIAQEYTNVEVPISQTESPKPPLLTSTTPVKTSCNRNQYECRTSKDCIAIYNVCDGIPQCGDGSDEAVDLGCPTEKPTSSPPMIQGPIAPAPEVLKYPPIIHHKNYPPTYENSQEGYPKSWQMPMNHQALVPQPNRQYSPQGMVMSVPQVNYGPQGYLGDWEYRQMYDQNKGTYPIDGMNAKNEITHYEREQMPHIFNHKRPGVIENIEGGSYAGPERSYDPYYSAGDHESWPQNHHQIIQPLRTPEVTVTVSPVIQEVEEHPSILQKETKSTVGPAPIKVSASDNVPNKTNPSIKKELETQKSILPSSQKTPEAAVPPDKQEPVKAKIYNKPSSNGNEMKKESHSEIQSHHFSAEHLRHKENPDDLRPKGAVISLALGLTVTAIMAGLIACRLRVVRKRGRRGHGPYAHDADYLVNGMYL